MERIQHQSHNAALDFQNDVHINNKLNGLISALVRYNTPISHERLKDLLTEHVIDIADIKSWVIFQEKVYARNSILKLPNIEILVMCWKSGQLSPIHDHRGSACAVKVIQGTATEITYVKNSGVLIPQKTEDIHESEITASFDSDIHQIGNIQTEGPDLITLHCYSPPLSNMTLFPMEETIFCNYGEMFDQVSKRANTAAGK